MLTLRHLASVLKVHVVWAGIALTCGVLGALWPILTTPRSWDGPGLGIGIYIFGGLGLLLGTCVGAVVAFVLFERWVLLKPEAKLTTANSTDVVAGQ
jgi:hypothetical protein